MRIVISGYYGFSNAGDDAILEASLALVRKTIPDAQVTVISYPGGDIASVYRTTKLPTIDGGDVAHVEQVISRADLILIGGGGLIQDYLPSDLSALGRPSHNNLTFWTTLAIFAHAHEVPVSTWMIGIGPLSTDEGREHAGRLLRMMRTVSVRDGDAATLAEEVGVEPDRLVVGADPVLTWSQEHRPRQGEPRVGVAVRNWDGIDGWLTPLARALDRVTEERGATVDIIPFQAGRPGLESDDLMGLRLASRMQQRDRRSLSGVGAGPEELLSLVATCDVLVGMRLHSLIFATVADTPTAALSYDPKVRRFMRSIGREHLVVDLGAPDEETVRDLIESAWSTPVDGDRIRQLRDRLAAASRAVLLDERTRPDVSRGFLPALVGSITAAERDRAATEQQRYDGDLLGENARLRHEIELVRSEFQAFRDSRAVRLAQFAWDGKRLATTGVAAARTALAKLTAERRPPATAAMTIEDVLAEQPGDRGYVVFAPSIHWDVELFQRPQQMALAFARLGYTVLYQVDEQYRGSLDGYRKVSDSIYEGYVPADQLQRLAAVPEPLFMSYVYNYAWGDHLQGARRVYEHIDDLEVFEQVYPRSDLERWHRHAIETADIVVASATDLVRDVAIERPEVILVPNGVDADHFASTEHEPPSDLAPALDSTIVGYYGALAEWFDYPLLDRLAERRPDLAFVLIGPDYDGTLPRSGVVDRPNVHWLGSKPYGALPAYLHRFAVATIPFVVNEVTHAVSPLKLFEYMAGGVPVITPPLRECARYDEVLIAHGADEWSTMIDLAVELHGDPSYRERLRSAAAQNTWDARVRTILEALAD